MEADQDEERWRTRRTCVIRAVDSWVAGSALVSALESQGIAALLETMEDRAYDGLFTAATGAARLWVFEEDRERAEQVLEEFLTAQKHKEVDTNSEEDG